MEYAYASKPMCPSCNSYNFGKLTPPGNATSYVITTVDASKTPAMFNPTAGQPVDIYGCADCKTIVLKCESLSITKP